MLRGAEFECVAMLEGHTQDVKFVKWHPTAAATLLSASYDDTIKVWKEDNDDWYCSDTLTGHTSTVWGLSFDSQGNKFVSVSDDKSIIEWQCDSIDGNGSWRMTAKIKDLHELAVYTVDWSRQNGFISTGSADNSIVLCAPSSGSGSDSDLLLHEVARVTEAHDNDVNCVRWNPAEELGDWLVSTGDDGFVKLWRLTIM
jgi:WD40 repeat protein